MENNKQTVTPDTRNIVTEEDSSLEYWINKFGIGKDELLQALNAGATFTEAVTKYVKRVEFAL